MVTYSNFLKMYSKEEILDLTKQVRVTDEVHKILKQQKKTQEISIAKIVCNAIIEKYNN